MNVLKFAEELSKNQGKLYWEAAKEKEDDFYWEQEANNDEAEQKSIERGFYEDNIEPLFKRGE